MWLCTSCAGQQLLAIRDRDVRDLRQQRASRQEALVKSLRTIESLRGELTTSKYEHRESQQKVASLSGSISIQNQTLDRLETRNAKLQEKLRQVEIAYERLKDTYQEMRSVLGTTVSELTQTRRIDRETALAIPRIDDSGSERERLHRRIDELRAEVIRERAARRAANSHRRRLTPPPVVSSSPRIRRLTQASPTPETASPGSHPAGAATADNGGSTDGAPNAALGKTHLMDTALLLVLASISIIAVILVVFVVARRILRDNRATRAERSSAGDIEKDEQQGHADSSVAENENEDDVEDDYAGDEEPEIEQGDSDHDGEPFPGLSGEEERWEDTEKITEIPAGERELEDALALPSPDVSLADSLDWLNEAEKPSKRRSKKTEDAETKPSPGVDVDSESASEELKSPEPRVPAEVVTDESASSRHAMKGHSDTQVMPKVEEDDFSPTQMLPTLDEDPTMTGGGSASPGLSEAHNQEFTETSVLRKINEDSHHPEEDIADFDDAGGIDTQVMPSITDFQDEDPVDMPDEITGATGSGMRELPQDDDDKELLAELEELMGEKFEDLVT